MLRPSTDDALPLAAYGRVNTLDPDQAEEEVGRIFCSHHLQPLEKGAPHFHAIHNSARHDGFSVNYVAYGADVMIDPGCLDRFFLLQIPLAGAANVRCGAAMVEADARCGTLLSPTLPTTMRWRAGTAKLIILIDRDVMQSHASALNDHDAPVLEFMPQLRLDSAGGMAIRAQADLMVAMSSQNQNEAVQRHLRDSLLSLLLATQPQTGAQMRRPSAAAPVHVKRAEDYIRAHAGAAIDLSQLAAQSGVSLRTLQAGFRQFRNTCLSDAVFAARLDLWQKLLKSQSDGVIALALRAGLSHPGRAASAYFQRFGERPSDTRQKARRG